MIDHCNSCHTPLLVLQADLVLEGASCEIMSKITAEKFKAMPCTLHDRFDSPLGCISGVCMDLSADP